MKRTAHEVLSLLAEHGGHFFALLTRLTLRTDVAEDLMQELFCNMAQSRRFHLALDPYAYAFRAATNLAFRYRRAQKRVPRAQSELDDLPGRGDSPLCDLVRREELARVLDAVGRLPRTGRDIVVLRYLERQDYDAIARMLGKTSHQARGLCHKALAQLRRMLNCSPAFERESKET